MELRQRVSANGILMEQTAREYSIRDYEDVGDDFICEWLLRRFAGQHIVHATRQMLYDYMLRQIGPVRKYSTQLLACKALGVGKNTLKKYKHNGRYAMRQIGDGT